MDVYCSTCGEPYDTYHMRHDNPYDSLPYEEAQSWVKLPSDRQLSEHYRKLFQANGWEFGPSVLNIRRCPCCPAETATDIDHAAEAIGELLGDDLDGLACELEDMATVRRILTAKRIGRAIARDEP